MSVVPHTLPVCEYECVNMCEYNQIFLEFFIEKNRLNIALKVRTYPGSDICDNI